MVLRISMYGQITSGGIDKHKWFLQRPVAYFSLFLHALLLTQKFMHQNMISFLNFLFFFMDVENGALERVIYLLGFALS